MEWSVRDDIEVGLRIYLIFRHQLVLDISSSADEEPLDPVHIQVLGGFEGRRHQKQEKI